MMMVDCDTTTSPVKEVIDGKQKSNKAMYNRTKQTKPL